MSGTFPANEPVCNKHDEIRAKQAEQRERLRKRLRELQESWDAKIASIKKKGGSSKTEAKARHEEHGGAPRALRSF